MKFEAGKRTKTVLLLLIVLVLAYTFIIVDRDRSLWVLNTAINTVTKTIATTDISYGSQSWQQLDVYSPGVDAKNTPVLVFFHGGGWYHGRKDQYFFVADAFTRLGYTVVLPDYIKHSDANAQFPAHLVDAAKAIAWVHNQISRYGGNPDEVFIAGHSAGAHTAVMVATDMSYLQNEGLSNTELRGAVGIAGPYRFIPDTVAAKSVFGPEDNYPKMDPLSYIDGDEPPILVLHSDADQSIANKHPRELQAALESAGSTVYSVIYNSYSHEDMVTHLHPWFAGDDSLALEMDLFFKRLVN